MNPTMVVHNLTKAVNKCSCYVQNYIGWCSFTVRFREGIFVLAIVCLGFISVRCSELKGVRFSNVQNVLALW